jgi:uncharacterized protein (DUF433 family)
MGGKPCIRGMRVTVSRIVSQLAVGDSIEQLLIDYPCLEREDILQALEYAAIMPSGSYAALECAV